MSTSEPVAKTKDESEKRIESGEQSKQAGSIPSDTSENLEAPKQKKAAASPE
jgi:hypothetical protein